MVRAMMLANAGGHELQGMNDLSTSQALNRETNLPRAGSPASETVAPFS
jgi:hypothetical protein